jgi:hypothetical protein
VGHADIQGIGHRKFIAQLPALLLSRLHNHEWNRIATGKLQPLLQAPITERYIKR